MHRAIQRGRRRFGGQGGFTLFEVIMVLLILGIISYFATTRLFTEDGISRVAEMDLVKNHLRYAQSRAMNTESRTGESSSTLPTTLLALQRRQSDTVAHTSSRR